MGNVLESDGSTSMESDTESCGSGTDSNRIVNPTASTATSAPRTAGDGMASVVSSLNDPNKSPRNTDYQLQSKPIPSTASFPLIPIKPIDPNLIPRVPLDKDSIYESVQKSMLLQFKTEQVSPKNLPPKNKLIMIKPTARTKQGHGSLVNDEYYHLHMDSQNLPTPYSQFTGGFSKPRDPKFVPYEPYKGAVRSMELESSATAPGLNNSELRRNSQSSSSSTTTTTTRRSSPSDHNCNIQHPHSNSNLTLLKERLKISEKDNSELQNENTRLKKMIVDSLSGDLTSPDPINQGDHAGNLSDQIEVWRSKFLSSCVLVEQLTHENQQLKAKLNQASSLFQDIKHNVPMTPELYDKISNWTRWSQQKLGNYDDNYSQETSPNPSQETKTPVL